MGCISSKNPPGMEHKDSVIPCTYGQEEGTYLQNLVCYDEDIMKATSPIMGLASNAPPNIGSVPNVIADRYQIQGEALACGAFGCVYKAIDLKEKELSKLYAVKVEDLSCEYPQLGHEARMYKVLEGGEGIPRCYAYEEKDNKAVLVMDMLGESLQKLFGHGAKAFSVKTTLMLAEQMISRVQYLHESNYVHRDLKPANFVVGYPGTKNRNTVYLLDFGLAKKWRNHLTGQMRSNVQRYYGTVGTDMFASRIAHQGFEQGRKDDLESLGYIFLYFMKSLPWMNQQAGMQTEDILDDIREKKKNMPLENYNQGIPKEFMDYLDICRNMKFAEDPDYERLKDLFRSCAKRLNIPYPYSYKFDWD